MSNDPTCQAFADLQSKTPPFRRDPVGEVSIPGAVMQQIIFSADQHDGALFRANGIVEQGKCSIQRPVQIEAGGNLGKDSQ